MPIHGSIPKFLKKPLLIKGCCFCFIVLVQCHQIEEERAIQEPDNAPQLALKNWETIVLKQGHVKVHLRADSLGQKDAQGQAHFRGDIQVTFFSAHGDTASVLHAERGSVDPDGQNLSVAGKVSVLATDSTRLETDSLRWDREKERIYGEGLVSIFRPEGREQGVGFDASADLKQWTLREVETHVTGRNK